MKRLSLALSTLLGIVIVVCAMTPLYRRDVVSVDLDEWRRERDEMRRR